MTKRFALVIGAMKSGTTSLFRHLGSHPQVVSCRVKEPKFFSDDKKWQLGFDWYQSLWDFHEHDARIALEASTDYAKHPACACPAARIAQMPAEFRFIYLLRHPLERIESHHTHAYAEGWTDRDLEEGVLEHHVNVSRYAMQLEGYLEHFPREHFLLLPFEELKRDPLALMKRVCLFLEIDPYQAFPELEEIHNATLGRPLRRTTRFRLLAKIPGLRRAAGPRFSPRVRRKFTLSPVQRAQVLADLRDDLRRLEEVHGFDVSVWDLEGQGPGGEAAPGFSTDPDPGPIRGA